MSTSVPLPEELEPGYIKCIGCGLYFDCNDYIQSIFHEYHCMDIEHDHGRAIVVEMQDRLANPRRAALNAAEAAIRLIRSVR